MYKVNDRIGLEYFDRTVEGVLRKDKLSSCGDSTFGAIAVDGEFTQILFASYNGHAWEVVHGRREDFDGA